MVRLLQCKTKFYNIWSGHYNVKPSSTVTFGPGQFSMRHEVYQIIMKYFILCAVSRRKCAPIPLSPAYLTIDWTYLWLQNAWLYLDVPHLSWCTTLPKKYSDNPDQSDFRPQKLEMQFRDFNIGISGFQYRDAILGFCQVSIPGTLIKKCSWSICWL